MSTAITWIRKSRILANDWPPEGALTLSKHVMKRIGTAQTHARPPQWWECGERRDQMGNVGSRELSGNRGKPGPHRLQPHSIQIPLPDQRPPRTAPAHQRCRHWRKPNGVETKGSMNLAWWYSRWQPLVTHDPQAWLCISHRVQKDQARRASLGERL